jgi:hypothetical protein
MAEAEMSAILRICQDLELPIGDSFTQDWTYELPEEFRDEAAFNRYLSAYTRKEYGANEKRLLVQLALDIVNELLQQEEEVGRRTWSALANVLRMNHGLHRDQVEYWAMSGEPLENAFALTPLTRALWEELYV